MAMQHDESTPHHRRPLHHLCAVLVIAGLQGWVSPATSMENTKTHRLSSGRTASQAGEGFAAQSLTARASRMWIGTRRMEKSSAA